MADPRFFLNRGPLMLAELCARTGIEPPPGAAPNAAIADVAPMEAAGPMHLVFCADRKALAGLADSTAGFAIVPRTEIATAAGSTLLLPAESPARSFAEAARLLYPEHGAAWSGESAADNPATIAADAQIHPSAVIGSGAEIGEHTRIGPNAVIGPGVSIGRHCEIASNVTITHAYLGDHVSVLPGAQIGQAGFGFASGAAGHFKIPQLGRVIIQDHVEIGACTTVDRGALADTVIGEGTKIDNLVQIGHNCRIGRHCIIVGQVGISGSCELGEFVVLGGQAGVADHVVIGDGARFAARSAVIPGELPGGQDYGGAPAIPAREWRRQLAAIAMLGRRRKRNVG